MDKWSRKSNLQSDENNAHVLPWRDDWSKSGGVAGDGDDDHQPMGTTSTISDDFFVAAGGVTATDQRIIYAHQTPAVCYTLVFHGQNKGGVESKGR